MSWFSPSAFLATADRHRDPADRLRNEPIVWLDTLDARGRPHLVPTWFSWDGEAMWVF